MNYYHWVATGKSVQGQGKSSHEEFCDVVDVLQGYAHDVCMLITALAAVTDLDRADSLALVDFSLAKFMEDIGYEELAVDTVDLMEDWNNE